MSVLHRDLCVYWKFQLRQPLESGAERDLIGQVSLGQMGRKEE